MQGTLYPARSIKDLIISRSPKDSPTSTPTTTPATTLTTTQSASKVVSYKTASLLLGLVIIIWGSNWPIMKIAMDEQLMAPFTFALCRLGLAAVLMFIVSAMAGQLRLPSKNDWPVVLSIGLLQMGLFMGLVNYALQFVPASRSVILTYTTPIWVVPMAILIFDEKIEPRKWFGFGLGVAGIIVMFNPFTFDWSDLAVLKGNGILVLTAFLWAILMIHIRGHQWEGTPLSLAPWQFLVAMLILMPITFWLESDRDFIVSGKTALVLLYNGPLATAFCFWAMITFTRALPAINTSVGMLGVPVVGVMCSTLILGEVLTFTNIAALLLIGGGLLTLTLADLAQQKVPDKQ